jgi:hypothetical protein
VALTPITVTKSGQRTLVQYGDYIEINSNGFSYVANGLDFNSPYAFAGGNWADNADPYNTIFARADGTLFGAYFPTLSTSGNISQGSITNDLTQLLMTYNIVASPTISYKIVALSLTSIDLTTSRFPPTGTITLPASYFSADTQGLLDRFVGGIRILAVNANDYRCGTITSIFTTAFTLDALFTGGARYLITTNDGIYNYTLLYAEPLLGIGNSISLAKWQEGVGFTNYQISLSDPDDQALWEIGALWEADYPAVIRGNSEKCFVEVHLENNTLANTVFIFASDYSSYERVDYTSNGFLDFGMYFQDIDGVEYLLGTHVDAPNTPNFIGPLVEVATLGDDIIELVEQNVVKLPCFAPCINFAIKVSRPN